MLRKATYAAREMTGEAGLPVTVAILREYVSTAGDASRGIAPVKSLRTGLTAIAAHVHSPQCWDGTQTVSGIELKQTERLVVLVDVPATSGVPANTVLLSDKLKFNDQVYGANAIFEVVEVHANQPAGLVTAKVVFARES
jgi:hypothetical protein